MSPHIESKQEILSGIYLHVWQITQQGTKCYLVINHVVPFETVLISLANFLFYEPWTQKWNVLLMKASIFHSVLYYANKDELVLVFSFSKESHHDFSDPILMRPESFHIYCKLLICKIRYVYSEIKLHLALSPLDSY